VHHLFSFTLQFQEKKYKQKKLKILFSNSLTRREDEIKAVKLKISFFLMRNVNKKIII
jgi:hypothetical protein